MSRSVKIFAPSRLHFGLLRFACATGPSFGGLGMMIDRPRAEAEFSLAAEWKAEGRGCERALLLAKQAAVELGKESDQPLRIRLLQTARSHSGLGSGTQLALSVAKGVDLLLGSGSCSLDQLVSAVGRGQRGSVGSYGFAHGGLIWEKGKLPGEKLAPLCQRVELPEDWRVVLVTIENGQGLSGEIERTAFEQLPPVPTEVTDQLILLAERRIIPAAEDGDFETFSEATYEYGVLAGKCFSAVQGGPFASPAVAALIRKIRASGVKGVGQSSWGPTVFALAPGKTEAESLLDEIDSCDSFGPVQLEIARPDNRGVLVELRTDSSEQSVADKSFAQ